MLSNHPENVGPGGVPTVLLLDATNSPFQDQAYARSQMLKYVLEQGQTGQPMAVFTLSDRLHVLQQFTSDPQVLMTAIRNFKPAEQILQRRRPPATALRSWAGQRPAAAVGSAGVAIQQFANLQVGYSLERRTLITLEAMNALSVFWVDSRAARMWSG